jgi:hypothetical protein
MAKGREVLHYLRPEGGWFIEGDSYEGIQFLHCDPLTKAEFDLAFENFDSIMAAQEAAIVAAKQAAAEKLAALGLTTDDLKALGL